MQILRRLHRARNVTLLFTLVAAIFFNWALTGPFTVFQIFAILTMADLLLVGGAHAFGSVVSWYRIGASEEYGRAAAEIQRRHMLVDMESHLTPEEVEQFRALNAKLEAAYEDVGT